MQKSIALAGLDRREGGGPLLVGAVSVHFVVGPDGLEQDGLSSLVLDEREEDAQIVACTASLRAYEAAFELVGSEWGVERVFSEQDEGPA